MQRIRRALPRLTRGEFNYCEALAERTCFPHQLLCVIGSNVHADTDMRKNPERVLFIVLIHHTPNCVVVAPFKSKAIRSPRARLSLISPSFAPLLFKHSVFYGLALWHLLVRVGVKSAQGLVRWAL